MTDGAPAGATLGVIPAGFWRRVAAWVIDTIIVLICVYLVGSFLWPELVKTTTHISENDGARLEVVSYALSTLGTAVFGGMLGVTVFGLLFTPVFYVLIRGLVSRRTETAPAPAE